MARLKPESESNVIVAHHMGGWFEIDKSIFASVATLFAPLLTSNPEVKRVLLPDTVSSSVFVAFKGMFHGDEVDIELQDLVSFTFQLESIGVKVLRIYHNTLVNDVRPMVITKRLYKLWRAVILWPRHESDRLEEDRIRPFYTAYVPNDTPCQEFKLYEKQDMLKSVDFYGIHFSHGDFRNKLFCVGPNCKIFKVRRKKMVGLSYLKYNTFQQFAGDINYVVLPAQVSEYSFEKFESLLIHGSCEIEMEKFSEFRDELKSVGLSIERSECIAADHQSQYRVLATKDAHSMVKYICEWNPGYAFNPAEAIEEPIMEITHLTMNDVDPEQEPDSEPKPEPEAEPSKKRKCFI